MSFYFDRKAQSWVVQLQRTAPDGEKLRRCIRVRGSRTSAETAERKVATDLDGEIKKRQQQHEREAERRKAAETLGIEPATILSKNDFKHPPKLRDYLLERWARHVLVVQNATTRRTTQTHVAYLVHYLGDLRLDEVDEAAVARFRESLLTDGPLSFKMNRSGKPRKTRAIVFKPRAVNRIVASLAAALRLAERERTIDRAPAIDLLPSDDSESLVPPSDADLHAILNAARDFTEIAPLMPEAIELAAETGMRAGEQFTLRWRSVDFGMGETGAIRIEKQPGVRMIDGRAWMPKHKKFRVIPLTDRARVILLDLRRRVPSAPDDPVVPSRGGSPYNRLEAAPDKAGMGYFPNVVEAASLLRHVRWHDLRHYFAVRALLKGVPIAVVSSWLGHSDVNLTVKTYGRWASEAMEQWRWARVMGEPANAVQARPLLPPLASSSAGSNT